MGISCFGNVTLWGLGKIWSGKFQHPSLHFLYVGTSVLHLGGGGSQGVQIFK